jgi:hypothetical protein
MSFSLFLRDSEANLRPARRALLVAIAEDRVERDARPDLGRVAGGIVAANASTPSPCTFGNVAPSTNRARVAPAAIVTSLAPA